MPDDSTSAFYDNNADLYANRARSLPKQKLDAFLARLAPGAAILELGCGGGQDSAYMLAQGFAVTPTDGSAELARQAEARIGRPVKVMLFQELDADSAFHGVWAHASLLHVPRSELPDVFTRIHRALKPGGLLHASFKAGEAEGYDGFGRYYNYPSAEWLSALLTEGGWRNLVLEESDGGGYDGKPTRWIVVSAQR
ncbi:class I SAM-dependent DNA methyltransferase [Rhizobium lentis]|uniref:class I SAM-dependent DNA methyltransferase n=1 Tax=Rhizobium lentis TaxID=1138194 RepID=UPI001A921728|nr:class I SAM-dependent methyltransferase [Rhizobium lentis]MBX4997375.1 class I SAM-dependent methyltransferase [Rhizobium lentis]MBX5015050.1 class I SAM-dependent methyltransferase [Rhizobium lentis]MBX5064211.1 class I SAM-dependent methyltransferase [Rhizobium lentis]MBX5076317.1 class I SAM-dependent methyltransferase [Rhizobium lentis]QSW93919.1 class I SAM-dependent methyltransferase [Rhizobium lentis]